MQEYTRLKAEELKNEMVQEMHFKWTKIASARSQLNAVADSGFFSEIRETGIKLLTQYINKLCEFERKAVLNKTDLPNDYFDALIADFIILTEPIFDEIKNYLSGMTYAYLFQDIIKVDREKEVVNVIYGQSQNITGRRKAGFFKSIDQSTILRCPVKKCLRHGERNL